MHGKMLRFVLLLGWIGRFLGTTDPSVLTSADGDVQIMSDFSSMRITFTKKNTTDSDFVYLNSEALHKSILNFGQLTPRVRAKLANNECLNMMVFGTSVSCGMSDDDAGENRLRSAEDAWPHQLQAYMNTFLPACHSSDGKSSKHKLIRVHCACAPVHAPGPVEEGDPFFSAVPTMCERGASQDYLIEGVLLGRLDESSQSEEDLAATDIVFVEAVDDLSFPFVNPSFSKRVARITERFIQVIRRHKSQPSVIYVAASMQLGNTLMKLSSNPSGSDTYNGVSDQLPVAKHYSVPYVSVVNAFEPFISNDMKQWWVDMFLSGFGSHPSRTGHKIDALLLLYYLKQVQLSLLNPLSTSVDTYKYLEVESVTPLHFTAQQLQEYVLDLHHQPLTIVLNTFAHLRGPYLFGNSDSWVITKSLHPAHDNQYTGENTALTCDQVGGSPFSLIFPADILAFHFHKRHLRVVVGKSAVDMGSVHVQVTLQGVVVFETTIDCLKSASKDTESSSPKSVTESSPVPIDGTQLSSKDEADFLWFFEEIHLPPKLDIDAKAMIISFVVVESTPKREHNVVKLSSVTLS